MIQHVVYFLIIFGNISWGKLAQGIIVLDLELREGNRFFFTKFLYKVSSNIENIVIVS